MSYARIRRRFAEAAKILAAALSMTIGAGAVLLAAGLVIRECAKLDQEIAGHTQTEKAAPAESGLTAEVVRGAAPSIPAGAVTLERAAPEDVAGAAPSPEALELPALAALDDESLPCLDGLEAETRYQWENEDFLRLSLEDVGIECDGYDLSGPGLFVERLGGLPTEADCEGAWEDQAVREALVALRRLDVVLDELQLASASRRTRAASMALQDLQATRESVALSLMEALDRAGPYHNWTVLHRAYAWWSR